jgi:hypothetical protein
MLISLKLHKLKSQKVMPIIAPENSTKKQINCGAYGETFNCTF